MSFLKSILANIISYLIISITLLLLLVVVLYSASDETKEIPDNSFIELTINGSIADRSHASDFDFLNESDCASDLNSFSRALAAAKTDTKIQGVLLKIEAPEGSIANMESLRRAIEDFKTSKKPVYAYSDGYSQIGYYLASAADTIAGNRLTYVEWKGLAAQLLYFKNMFGKIGIEAQPIRAGKFKSAIEPFISDTISNANFTQISSVLNNIWTSIVSDVAKNRGIDTAALNRMANTMGYISSQEALDVKLIDVIKFEDEIFQNLNCVKLSEYIQPLDPTNTFGDSKIAVVFAEGSITAEEKGSDISSKKYAKIFDDILKDKSVKAVVLRINSPGGSAIASEVLWNRVKKISDKLPVIVSMGNVAASGGYYIASAADSIVAERTTITGSIGVFGLMFNTAELNKKLGLNVQKVKTHEMSDFPAFDRALSSNERLRFQKGVDDIYDLFLSRVATGRNMTKENVHQLAQGRIWTGNQALKIGLIDRIGGIDKAIEIAEKMAGLSNAKVVELPKISNPLEIVVAKLTGNKIELPAPFQNYSHLLNNPDCIKNLSQPQMRMPFVLTLN